jgi:hypothetical protein
MGWKAKILAAGASIIAISSISSAANAHMVQFGWKETSTGTVLYAEHWHGNLSSAYSDNGGLHITDVSNGTSITAQWVQVLNNTSTASLGLTGSQCDPQNAGCNTEQNWMVTNAIPLGNGVYDFFTGTNCCVDTMGSPVRVTVTGITNTGGGINNPIPGGVPEPSTWAMMILGFGLTGAAMRSRRTKVRPSFA